MRSRPAPANWPTRAGGRGASAAGPDSIDDLWHAAINSRGKYFNADNPQQLAESIVSALADFTDQSGTGTAVGIAGAQFTATRRLRLQDQLRGRLVGRRQEIRARSRHRRAAGRRRRQPGQSRRCGPRRHTSMRRSLGTGWDTNRRIVTINDSTNAAVPFRIGELSAAQQTSLNAGWSVVTPTPMPTAQAVLDYLRGDKSNEGVGSTNFRVRCACPWRHRLLGRGGGRRAQPALRRCRQSGLSAIRNGPGAAHADGLRRRQRRHGARVQRFDRSRRRQGNLGVHSEGALQRRRSERHRTTRRIPHSSSGRSAIVAAGFRSSRTSSTSTPRRAPGTSISPTPTPARRRNTGNDWRTRAGRRAWARAGARSTRSTSRPPSRLPKPKRTIATSGRVLWEFTDDRISATSSTPRRWSRRTASAGSCWSRPGYNNPGGKGFLYVLNPKTGQQLAGQDGARRAIPAPTPIRAACPRSAPIRRAARTRTCCRPTAATSRATSGASTCPIRTNRTGKSN